mgnify:CR=1 FL=1
MNGIERGFIMYDKLERGLFRSVKAKQASDTYTTACEEYALSKLRKLAWWSESKERTGRQMTRTVRRLNERKAARV